MKLLHHRRHRRRGATIDGGGASQAIVSGGGSVTRSAPASRRHRDGEGRTNQRPDHAHPERAAGPDRIRRHRRHTDRRRIRPARLVAGPLQGTMDRCIAAGGITAFAGARGRPSTAPPSRNFSLFDTIDVTSVGTAGAGFNWNVTETPGMTTVNVFDGHDGAAVLIAGTIDGTRFHLVPDVGLGVELVYKRPEYLHGGFRRPDERCDRPHRRRRTGRRGEHRVHHAVRRLDRARWQRRAAYRPHAGRSACRRVADHRRRRLHAGCRRHQYRQCIDGGGRRRHRRAPRCDRNWRPYVGRRRRPAARCVGEFPPAGGIRAFTWRHAGARRHRRVPAPAPSTSPAPRRWKSPPGVAVSNTIDGFRHG